MSDEVLAEVRASAPRRAFGVGTLIALGAILIYLAFVAPPDGLGLQAMLIAMGLGAVYLSERMRRATLLGLELTEAELRLSDGTVLAATNRIVSIDRGMFAFKPSNGFTLKFKDKAPARWEPGLCWCLGKRLGVGGVTAGAQTKMMADMISALVQHHAQPQDDPSKHS